MKKWVVRAVVIAGLAGLVALLVWGYWPRPLAVDVGRVTVAPLKVEIEEEGKTRVKDRYVVSAPLAGVVARSELHVGEAIEPGAPLATIRPLPSQLLDPRARAAAEARAKAASDAERQAKAALVKAQAALQDAQRKLARVAQLESSGTATREQLDQAQAAERVRRAELQSARFAVRVTAHDAEAARAALREPGPGPEEEWIVRSPVHGRVLKLIQQNETAVNQGTPLLEAGDPASLELVADFLTTDAVRIRPGQRAMLDGWGGPGRLAAHVRLIEPAAFTRVSPLGVEEQRVNAVLDFDDPRAAQGVLGDGYSVDVHVVVWESPSVLQLPASALFRSGTGWAVYRVLEGHARIRTVKLGQRGALQAQVEGGLQEGDEVVVHPPDGLRDGLAVSPRS